MSENQSPVTQRIKLKEFDTRQSRYIMVLHVPFRSSGQTILLQSMSLGIYRN